MTFLRLLAASLFFLSSPVFASEFIQEVPIAVTAFTADEIQDTLANMGPNDHIRFVVEPGTGGENTIFIPPTTITPPPPGFFNLVDLQRVEVLRGPQATLSGTPIFIDGSQAGRRLVNLEGSSHFGIREINVTSFATNGNGGVAHLRGTSTFESYRSQFNDNFASGNGGVARATDNSQILVSESFFYRNSASEFGGVMSIEGAATAHVQRSGLFDSDAGVFGCDMNLQSTGTTQFDSALFLEGSQFSGQCIRAGLEAPFGNTFSLSAGYYYNDEAIHATDRYASANSYYGRYSAYPNQVEAGTGGGKPQSLCEDFGTGAFISYGYNLSEDNSCGLNQDSDILNTDGMTARDQSGFYVPQAGSPLIDSGETDARNFPGESLEYLPCGYKDLRGLGRPQDANDDGVFECDRGAVEVQGPGALTPGHSAAFFNLNRDGEGQYVEMLNANTAIVYTFTHRPDGSGSMWFIGVGYVLGNSIVIDQLLRPSGTSFGSGFDAADIVNTFAGGQSMVFNDCEAAGAGGNVAFSGNRDIGLEALITRAGRLSNILGCGSVTPHPNAGLSGSYFLPARNGEGIVVQWLPNGQVLVILFTYDLNNNQQWVLGIGQSNGTSVTMDAVYASGNATWGSDYDADDVDLTPWGTFELNWTECGGVQFSYNSTVSGYGSATREYIRLSSLWEATCPNF